MPYAHPSGQMTLSDYEYSTSKRVTRRQRFLEQLDARIPWEAWEALVEPHYPRPGNGRPPVELRTMLRMYVVQVAFQLSDEGTEDALADSRAVRAFVGCEEPPDATTLCRFRHLLEENRLGEAMFAGLNAALAEEGLGISAGTIVDATFVESPSSTKNARRERDPEARQGKKGHNWHFGYKAHVGVDAESGTVHTLEVSPANEGDLAHAYGLLRPGDGAVWADAGYVGLGGRPEFVADAGGKGTASMALHVARRRKSVPPSERPLESMLASVRSRVEHAFHALKDLIGLRKTRYRGVRKVANQLHVAFALANCLLAGRRPPLQGPPACAMDPEGPRRGLLAVLSARAAAL